MYPTPSNSTELQNCDENIVTNISNHLNISQNIMRTEWTGHTAPTPLHIKYSAPTHQHVQQPLLHCVQNSYTQWLCTMWGWVT